MSKKIRKSVTFPASLAPEDITKLSYAIAPNYKSIIWNSIHEYNYKAQLDIANLIYTEFKNSITSGYTLYIGNLCLRMLQLYYEIADQLAIVFMSIINESTTPVYITYIENDNTRTKNFYKQCIKREISEESLKKVYGLTFDGSTLKLNASQKEHLKAIQDDILQSEFTNLELYGKSYTEYDSVTSTASFSDAVKGSTAVKHGFKMIVPSKLTKHLWDFGPFNPAVFQEICDVQRKDIDETVPLVVAGTLGISSYPDIDHYMHKLFINIEHLSDEILAISDIQLHISKNPYYSIKLLCEKGVVSYPRKTLCFCGSGKKFKRCHGA